MNVALIGGSGFIGRVLARALKDAGHNIRILDIVPSPDFPDESVIVDVRDQAALTEALKGIEVIYNLAAEHRDDVRPTEKYYDVNVNGASHIVKSAKTLGIKTIIFTSTVAVYGLNADPAQGATEDTPPAPFNHYGQSKLDAERVLREWATDTSDEDNDKSLVIMRLTATFGPENRGNIYTLIRQIARRRFIMIGRGHNKKSIAYVQNVAAFLLDALAFKPGVHLYNYADKPDWQTRGLIMHIRQTFGMRGRPLHLPYFIGALGGVCFDVLSKLTGRRFPVSLVRVRKFCADTVVNADKLDGTGFKRPYTLAQGLDSMIAQDFKSYIKTSGAADTGDVSSSDAQ